MARRAPRLLHAALAATAALALGAPAARAAFPGENGALAIGRAYEDRPEETTRFEIQSVAPDGRGRQTLLSCSRVADDCPGAGAPAFPGLYDPVRSPDGERLAIGLGNGIGIAAADGGGLRELAGLPPGAREPAWSPDGRELVFAADGADPGESDLYVAPVDGGLVRALTVTPGVSERQPTWGLRPAADGGRISYVRGSNIWSLRPDGQGVRAHTYKGGSDPSFSPYASTIAFVRRNQIYTVRARAGRLNRGGDLDRVTNLGGSSPTWSSDGRRIAFIRGGGSATAGIYRMGPKGGALTRFARAVFDSSCECTFERSLDWGPRR
jgi:dipeptidyl aminopeptidase/acylaminoacyl peptidase